MAEVNPIAATLTPETVRALETAGRVAARLLLNDLRKMYGCHGGDDPATGKWRRCWRLGRYWAEGVYGMWCTEHLPAGWVVGQTAPGGDPTCARDTVELIDLGPNVYDLDDYAYSTPEQLR